MVSCDSLKMTYIDGLRCMQHQNETIPLMDFAEIQVGQIILSSAQIQKMQVVVLRSTMGPMALLVDSVDQQLDLVLKPLSQLVDRLAGFRGTSILPDERITYIIDIEELMLKLKNPQVRAA